MKENIKSFENVRSQIDETKRVQRETRALHHLKPYTLTYGDCGRRFRSNVRHISHIKKMSMSIPILAKDFRRRRRYICIPDYVRNILAENTSIINLYTCKRRFKIFEALMIKIKKKPTLNSNKCEHGHNVLTMFEK